MSERSDFRVMRLILMFDLPMQTKSDIKNYNKFKKSLNFYGFNMLQYSVYTRICRNESEYTKQVRRIKNDVPKKGSINILRVTESQYKNMEYIIGERNERDELEEEDVILFE